MTRTAQAAMGRRRRRTAYLLFRQRSAPDAQVLAQWGCDRPTGSQVNLGSWVPSTEVALPGATAN